MPITEKSDTSAGGDGNTPLHILSQRETCKGPIPWGRVVAAPLRARPRPTDVDLARDYEPVCTIIPKKFVK